MNEIKAKRMGMLMMIGVLLGLSVMGTAAMIPSGSHAAVSNTMPYAALNATNATVMGDSAFIMGYYPSLDLYVTLPTNTSGPMITPFEINVTAYGQAVESLYVGKALYSHSQFTGNVLVYDNASYSGNVNLTLSITSAQGTSAYRWSPDFMSPVTYISYEKAKVKAALPGLSYEEVAAIGVAIILAAVAFFKIFYPGAKARVRKMWIKEGPKRHV